MPTYWKDLYAKCPYFLRTDGKREIACQGVADSSDLSWKFHRKSDLEIQFDTFCCNKYAFCEVHTMLKKIYESEE